MTNDKEYIVAKRKTEKRAGYAWACVSDTLGEYISGETRRSQRQAGIKVGPIFADDYEVPNA